jgi:hypothetical protein
LDPVRFLGAVAEGFQKNLREWYIANQDTLPQQQLVVQIYQDISLLPHGPHAPGQRIRAHPTYSPTNRYWYDYVHVQYSLEHGDQSATTANGLFPACCACFFTLPHQFLTAQLQCLQTPESHAEVLVLVQGCMYASDERSLPQHHSTITKAWSLESTLVRSSQSGLDVIARLECIPHSCIDKVIFALDLDPVKVDHDTVFVHLGAALQDPFYRRYVLSVTRSNFFDILEVYDRKSCGHHTFCTHG